VKAITHDLGWFLRIPGWLAIPPMVVGSVRDEWDAVAALAWMVAPVVVGGFLVGRHVSDGDSERGDDDPR
jgi:hypothetical protein